MISWLMLIVGLIALVLGAEVLVRGAVALAGRLGVSPLVIGLTVVAFGTSSPEFAVSLNAVAEGEPDLVMGNVVGSNIFNVLCILGLAALIRPLLVQQRLLRVEVPLMIGTSCLLWLLLLDGSISRIDGAILLAGVLTYTALTIRSARREPQAVQEEYVSVSGDAPRAKLMKSLVLIALGLGITVFGSEWLVAGAVTIASDLGVSTLLIGVTIVAAGTSLPELATSVVAVFRGQRDIAVGNVIGSNLVNIFGILGLAGVVAPGGIDAAPSLRAFDLPVMIGAAVVCLPLAFTGLEIRRWEGGVLIGGYVAYILYLAFDASGHAAIEEYSVVMLCFVIPLVTLGIGVSVIASQARRK